MPNKNKVVFVTGGSGVLGSAIVKTLNDNGLITVVGYNNSQKKAESLLGRLKYPNKSLLVNCDLENRDSIKKAFKIIHDKLGRLDFLVNNSAYTIHIPTNLVQDIDSVILNRIFDVNFKGASFCTFEALKYMPIGKGSVVNILSNSLKTHNASNIMYIASKAALQSFTESMSVYYGKLARFNSIAPGLIKSDMTKNRYKYSESIILEKTPTGRLSTPEDVAYAVRFLLLEGKGVNGQTLYVDGGRTVGS